MRMKIAKTVSWLTALRQCDGAGVQCLVLARDDFYASINRFFQKLEVRIVEDQNSALVDLFDIAHARKVLTAFGRAYGKLPEPPEELSQEQTRFLKHAVDSLADSGTVICVRLAVFAEMMKRWPWTDEGLNEIGGTEGVGVTFLEETFSAKTAPPTHRLHEQSIQAVLGALLPEQGTEIRGRMQSYDELLEVSGYRGRGSDFDAVLDILDSEVRLITPTEANESVAPNADSIDKSKTRYYQLTHDFLVSSLREWLTRKQRETRRGRAALRLAERAQLWHAKPETRQLPSCLEWLSALMLTDAKSWSRAEKAVVRASTTYYLRRTLVLVFAGLLAFSIIAFGRKRLQDADDKLRAQSLLEQLQTGKAAHLPSILQEIAVHRDLLQPSLQEMASDAELDTRWRASLALLPSDSTHAEFLQQMLCAPDLRPEDFLLTRSVLEDHGGNSIDWAEQAIKDNPSIRFRAACALAGWNADHPILLEQSDDIGAELLNQSTVFSSQWCEVLYPARASLIDWLISVFPILDEPNQVFNCARAIYRFSDGETREIVSLLPNADDTQARALTDVLQAATSSETLGHIRELSDHWKAKPSQTETERDRTAQSIANLAVSLWLLGDDAELAECMQYREDPRLRTYAQLGLSAGRVSTNRLLDTLADTKENVSLHHGVLIALTDHVESLRPTQRPIIAELVKELYQTQPDSGPHSACRLILDRLGYREWLEKFDSSNEDPFQAGRRWHTNRWGHTLIHFQAGDRPVGMSSKEVTYDQFKQFDRQHQQILNQQGDLPAVELHLHEAIRYCQWLSEQEFPSEQWCYPPLSELSRENMKPVNGYLDRMGYRLPTVNEWQIACRAGTVTPRFYGFDPDLLPRYAWGVTTSKGRLAAVGSLLPNRAGFFDMYGNVREICTSSVGKQLVFSACGSTARSQPSAAVSDFKNRLSVSVNNSDLFLGFRIARTLPE